MFIYLPGRFMTTEGKFAETKKEVQESVGKTRLKVGKREEITIDETDQELYTICLKDGPDKSLSKKDFPLSSEVFVYYTGLSFNTYEMAMEYLIEKDFSDNYFVHRKKSFEELHWESQQRNNEYLRNEKFPLYDE